MHSQKDHITYVYVSYVFLGLALFFFFIFLMLRWRRGFLPPTFICLAAFAGIYFNSINRLKLPEGYTLLQAVTLYFQCKNNGYNEASPEESFEILKEVAKNERLPVDFSDTKALKKAYDTGKKAATYVTNPFVLFMWKLQGYKK